MKIPKLALAVFLAMAMVCSTTVAENSPQAYVGLHNAARAQVNVGPVSWDGTVAAYALSYANKQRAGDCRQLESSGGQYGENLFWGSAGADWTAANAVNAWVAEKKYYDYGSDSCAAGQYCGHYTQVVWRNSTAIGCARVVCDNDGGVIIICSYNPPGNFVGQRPY